MFPEGFGKAGHEWARLQAGRSGRRRSGLLYVDRYCAILSQRPPGWTWSPAEGLEIMAQPWTWKVRTPIGWQELA